MIKFKDLNRTKPYPIFKKFYNKAVDEGQDSIDAISISSFNKETNEVNSRFVNLKFIDNNRFAFFTNYNSPKSVEFESHDQICAVFYWSAINVQVRMKAKIYKMDRDANIDYFKERSAHKNILAISSHQSQKIASYEKVLQSYIDAEKNKDSMVCPAYWGGFYFIPYYFEFWEGHESRINKRELFEKVDGEWKQSFLQP